MADMTGIRVRHAKDCRTREEKTARCNCSPTYEASVTIPRSRKKIRESFPSVAAARSWRIDAMGAVKRGSLREPTSTTLRQAAEAYIAGMKSGAVRTRQGRIYKPSVIRSYEQALSSRGHEPMKGLLTRGGKEVTRVAHVRASILDELGARKLSAIDRRDLQGVVKRMLGAGCNPSTIANTLMPVRVIFRQAIEDGEIVVNPAAELRLPAVTGTRLRIADPAEAAALLDALTSADDRALWATAIYSGLRLGELQALDSSCVDLSAGVILVERSYDRRERLFVDVKSSSSHRRVPIADVLRTELRAHFARKLAKGARHGLVFGRTPELPFTSNNMRGRAQTAWRKQGLDPLGFHEARHTYASLMIAAGVNVKAISTYMGHASVNITLDRYGHLMPNDEVRVAAQLDEYLANAKAGQ